MAKKRTNQEGTIYKRPNGTWRAQIAINGERLSYSAKTQRECAEWLKETNQQVSLGFNIKAGSKLLHEFLQEWQITIKSSRRPSTIRIYRDTLNRHVIPILGRFELQDIRPEHVQSLYARKLHDGYSDHSVHRIHQVLHVALEQAMKLRLIPRNPASPATPPRPKTEEMSFYDEDQVQTFLLAAMVNRDQYHPLYYLAIHTGMRQGELLGLKWDDLDWNRQTLKIHRQLAYMKGGVFEFREPKTNAGKRTILLGKAALDVLRDHRELQEFNRKRKGKAWQEHGMIFASKVGTPANPSNLRRSFRDTMKKSGLPKIRFHDLRHTAATLMLNNGIPVLVVSRRLGHAKPSITMDVYGHLIPGKQTEVVELMDQILTPISFEVAPELHQK